MDYFSGWTIDGLGGPRAENSQCVPRWRGFKGLVREPGAQKKNHYPVGKKKNTNSLPEVPPDHQWFIPYGHKSKIPAGGTIWYRMKTLEIYVESPCPWKIILVYWAWENLCSYYNQVFYRFVTRILKKCVSVSIKHKMSSFLAWRAPN